MELTESAYEGIDTTEVLELLTDDFTLIVTSLTHAAPFDPHAFTCSTCVPVEEEMLLLIDWLLMTVVSLLLSNEYPIALTFVEEQVVAYAERVNVVDTSASFAGLLTVTPASAGREKVKTMEDAMVRFRKNFIRFLCDRGHRFRADFLLASAR